MDIATIRKHDEACERAKAELEAKGTMGPWNAEPNRVNWKHAGLDCMIVRHPSLLHWCGYVGVPDGHSLHGKDYSEVGELESSVHGGLTYARACDGHICHIPQDGEQDNVWWFGFDCAHSGDISPGSGPRFFDGDHYRDAEYVKSETERLAESLTTCSPEG